MILLLISFLAGILTVLAPCVLPLLPVIVGGSLSDIKRKSKPYIIAGSLAVSVVIFTLLLKASTLFIDIPESFWKWVSGIIIIVFGISLAFPKFWEARALKVNILISRSSNKLLAEGEKKNSFWGDVLMGAALGPVFSSCSPTYFVILATVLPQSFATGLIYLIAYAVGLALSLLAISLVGQRLASRLESVADPRGLFKRTLGFVFLVVGIAIIAGADKSFQTYLISSGIYDPSKIEEKLLSITEKKQMSEPSAIKDMKYKSYTEIVNPSGFLNTAPIKLSDIVGKKIIILDFMTYSCINCQRTFPYLNAWYEKYKDQGLEIVAIHTPEFAFEKNIDNVRKALQEYGIKFPVVLDNDYSTWNAYGNNVWPRKYLIDIDGYIRYDHKGEGEYKETEEKIRELLSERAERLKSTAVLDGLASENLTETSVEARSRETYFGAFRNEFFGNGQSFVRGEDNFDFFIPKGKNLKNKFFLEGLWKIESEYIEPKETASLHYWYQASKVFLVAEGQGTIEVFKDGQLSKTISIEGASLYTLIDENKYHEGYLMLKVPENIKLYTFTFG